MVKITTFNTFASQYLPATLALISVLVIVFWLPSVARHLKECFVDRGQPDTNHNVNLPLNTTFECRNICGPRQTCALTGESCTSDVDCAGCQPPSISAPPSALVDPEPAEERGAYTSLDWGAPLQSAGPDTPAPTPEQRTTTWRSSFDTGNRLFQASQQQQQQPDGTTTTTATTDSPYSLSYPPSGRTTLSGEFADNGPLPSNRG
jgi:hypothetical protein